MIKALLGKLQFYRLREFLNIKLAMLFFHNLNVFNYNLFNKFYKLFICNNNKIDGLESFLNRGYQKLNIIDSKKITELRKYMTDSNIQNAKVVDGQTRYNITNDAYKVILSIFKEDLKDTISKLEEYYNAKIILSGALVTRNSNVSTKKETFSNYLHNDGYLFTTNQIFINLMDVDYENGPLHFLDFEQQKKFIKKISFFNTVRRYFFEDHFKFDELNHNIGNSGNAILVNTAELMHAAGTPKKDKFRDILFLEISAIPKSESYCKKMNIEKHLLNHNNNILTKKIAKPENNKSLLKYFTYYFFTKKNKNFDFNYN